VIPPSPVTVPLPLMKPPPAAAPAPAAAPKEKAVPPAAAAPAARPRLPAPPPPQLLARLLAAGLLVAVAAYCLPGPWQIFLPFPWHAGLREAFHTERRAGIFLQIDRAARTFFLLEGRFPESLAELEQAGLLPRSEVVDARGGKLDYSATATSFSLQAPGGASRTVGIGGNFLLDPEFQARVVREEPPLVLLD
jgi:hypothetical protein